MSKKIKVDPNQKEFFILKFKELNISLSEFWRVYNVELLSLDGLLNMSSMVKRLSLKLLIELFTPLIL